MTRGPSISGNIGLGNSAQFLKKGKVLFIGGQIATVQEKVSRTGEKLAELGDLILTPVQVEH